MTRAISGDTLNKLIVRHWGYYNTRLANRISRLNHLNRNNQIITGRNYLITPQEIQNTENRQNIRITNNRVLDVETERLRAMGILTITDIIQRFDYQADTIPAYTESFALPLDNPQKITSRFGTRRDPFGHGRNVRRRINGRIRRVWQPKYSFHNGLDYQASFGTEIKAVNAGRVIFSGSFGGYGNLVILVHQSGNHRYYTIYAHNSKCLVNTGDTINKGQSIALSGASGRATGPHLHFELRNAQGCIINPNLLTHLPIANEDETNYEEETPAEELDNLNTNDLSQLGNEFI